MIRAIYPGSFDPVTNGHLDIIERAASVFDELVVLVAVHSEKNPLFTVQERLSLIRQSLGKLANVAADSIEGRLLVDYARERKVKVLVKGLRALTDFDYEFQMALMNKKLFPSVETLFFVTRDEHAFLSSSIVKEVARLGGDVSSFVPPPVAAALKKAFAGPAEGGTRGEGEP